MTGLTQDQIRTRARHMVDNLHNPNPPSDAIADQIEFGMNLPHALVENYFANGPRSLLPMHIAENRLGKLRSIVDQAKNAYDREFGSPAGHPERHPSGYTREAGWSTGGTPDTRAYAIIARHPFERTPITSQVEFNDFVREARKQPMCDLQVFGPSCDAFLSSDGKNDVAQFSDDYTSFPHSIILPVVRGDLIVSVSICLDCRAAYYLKHGVSSGETVDPDDVID